MGEGEDEGEGEGEGFVKDKQRHIKEEAHQIVFSVILCDLICYVSRHEQTILVPLSSNNDMKIYVRLRSRLTRLTFEVEVVEVKVD